MRKLAASLVATLPLLAAAQETAQNPAQPGSPQYAPPPQQAEPAPQYPPDYAPPPQYTPPPPPQGQAAPPPQYAPPPTQYPPAQPQPNRPPPRQRDSWYIGFGFGGGDARISLPEGTFSTKELLKATPTRVALNFKVGATLTPRLLLGGEISALAAVATRDGFSGQEEHSVGISTLSAMVTFFPRENGFFVRGGLGLAGYTESHDVPGLPTETVEANGVSLIGGIGYAFWLGRQFNLTANLDFSGQSYGGDDPLAPDASSFWTLGVGFDWY